MLVTGATGMVGRQLVKKLLDKGAKVRGVSLDEVDYKNNADFAKVEFILGDLRNFDFCKQITSSVDIVFHLAGIKGSPLLTKKQPNSFFVNTMMFNLNVIEASRINRVDKLLYTSSVGVYSPSDIFKEESVWRTMPSDNDKFAGWAKRMGELQLEAAKIEHNFGDTFIVRPANIYGPWDNFDPNTAMVIPSLISRVISGENPLSVWGDGSSVRDFVYSEDVADAMLFVMENNIHEPVNIGSASGVTVKEITEILVEIVPELRIKWDSNMPSGDKIRVMDTSKLTNHGFKPKVTLRQGITQTFNWYNANQEMFKLRYNAFTEMKS